MNNFVNFIEINPKKDIEELVAKYEEETDTKLQPAQDARIMLNVIAYYANLQKIKINEAANLNLVENSRYPILDFLGKYKNCPRNSAKNGYDILKITLKNEAISNILFEKGFQVSTKDGLHIFETTKDLIISKGDLSGNVEIKSLEANSQVNSIAKNEIDTIITDYTVSIDAVTNLYGVSGGADDENDESYIKRILLAPEGFSVAGPELAYIYFALSAHNAIKDVSIDIPDDNPSVTYNLIETILKENSTTNENFNIDFDPNNDEITLLLNKNLSIGDELKIKIPHPYKLNLYALCSEEQNSEVILNAIQEKLSSVRPCCDFVVANFATYQDFEISGTVYLKKDAIEEIVKNKINEALNSFLDEFKNVLNKSVVVNKIITKINSVDGVYDFIPTKPSTSLLAKKDTCYRGKIGEIKYERVSYE